MGYLTGYLTGYGAGSLTGYLTEVAVDSPAAWWHLNEPSGTTATDAVGTNHGTYEGSPTLGVAGLALNDTGTAVALSNQASRQAIQVPNSATLNPDSITVELLVSVVGWDSNNRILQKGATDNHYRLYREASDNTIRWDLPGHGVVSTPAFYGRHHVAGTYDAASGRVRLYVDGTLVASTTGTAGALTDTTDALLIGHKSTTSPASDGLDGTIDEVAVYTTELSAARIAAHAAAAPITPTQLAWKGYTWNLASRPPAAPFVNAFSADRISVDGSGYLHLSVAAAAGMSVGAELSTVTQGLGYGTYTCVIGSRVDNLHPNVVVGGMFTYGTDAAYGHREIDTCEQSMWSGATGPCTLGHVHWQSSVPGNPYGARGGYDAADVTTLSDTTQTNVMVWEPGRITYRTYHGIGTNPVNLFREDTVTDGDPITFDIEGGGTFSGAAVIPVPGDERVHFNLWVCPNFSGTSDPATVTPTDVIIQDFTFTPGGAVDNTGLFDGIRYPRITVLAAVGTVGTANLCIRGTGIRGTSVRGGTAMAEISVDSGGRYAVRSIERSFGRASPIDSADPGTCTIVVNNGSGDYDPSNPASPYVGTAVAPFTTASNETQPILNYAQFGTAPSNAASPSGCTNSVVHMVTHTNLLANPSFETNTTGWFEGSGTTTIARSTTQADTGTASLALTKTVGAGTATANTAAPDLGQGAGFAMSAGQTYTFRGAWRAATAGRNCQLRIICYNSGGTNIGDATSTGITDTTGAFTPDSVSITAPAGTTQGAVQAIVNSAALSEVHRFDSADIHQGTETTYVPAGTWPANGSLQDVGGASAVTVNGTNPAVASLPYTFWQDLAAPGGGFGWQVCRWKVRPEIDPAAGAGYYFANQGALEAVGGTAGNGWYAGLQANTTFPGSAKVALFSVWNAVTAEASGIAGSLAQPFGGEGEGYQCFIPYPWVAGRTYSFECAADPSRGARWFSVHVRDETTGIVSRVGSIQAGLADSGRLYGQSYQWTELFSQTSPATTCPLLPRATAFFATPTFSTSAVGASSLNVGTDIQVVAEWPLGQYWPRFTGKITKLSLDAGFDPTVTITCADGLNQLGRSPLPVEGYQFGDDRSGQRIRNLADRAAWPATKRNIDTGYSTLQPTALGTTTSELLRQVEMTEMGLLFVSENGTLTFYDRHQTSTASRSVAVQLRITDTSGAGEVGMVELVMDRDTDRVYNDIHLTRDADPSQDPDLTGNEPGDEPAEQIAQDAASILVHGNLNLPAELGKLHTTDAAVLAQAQGLLGRYAVIQDRIESVLINALHPKVDDENLWPQLLALTLLDRIAVSRDYGPNAIAGELLVQAVREEINSDPPTWQFTLTTAIPPAPPASPICIRGSGVRGTNKRVW